MKKYKLGDVTDNFDNLRVPLSENKRKKRAGKYRYYGAQEIIEYIDDYIFDGEYILVAEDGNNLISGVKPLCTLVRGKFWVNNHAHIIKANEKADNKYLMYLLNNINIRKYVTGSAQPKLNKKNLNNIDIYSPNIEEQQKISSKIYTFDKKINNNNELIKKLHQILELLLKKIFIDNKDDSIKIEYKLLSELVDINTNSINPKNNPEKVYKHYSIPVFDITKTYSEEIGEKILSNKYRVTSNNLLVSKLNPQFKRIIYPMEIDEAICSTEFVVWEPKEKNLLEYLYVLANSERFTTYCINASSGTSNSHKRVKPEFMMKYKVPYNEEIVFNFNEMVKPMVKKINLLLVENNKLIEARNILVNKLIK